MVYGAESGMNNRTESQTFVSIRYAASELGIPVCWLEQQAKRNAIPAIRAGRRWLVHLERTRAKLTKLADQVGEVSDE